MKSVLILIAIVALAFLAPAPLSSVVGQARSDLELKPMPAIKLQTLDGKSLSPDGLKGNITLVDFWATWCGPCIVEIPMLNRLQEKYGDRGLKVVGVTLASGEAKEVKPFVSRLNMKYTVLLGDDDQTYDLNIIGFPTTYLVTRDWKIYRRYIGAGPRKAEQMEADIQKLLDLKK